MPNIPVQRRHEAAFGATNRLAAPSWRQSFSSSRWGEGSAAPHLEHGLLLLVGEQWRLCDDVRTLDGVLLDSLQALIGRQVEAVAPEAQQCLAVASVAGVQFTAVEVAVGLQCPMEDVAGLCDSLCQQGSFLVVQERVSVWASRRSSAGRLQSPACRRRVATAAPSRSRPWSPRWPAWTAATRVAGPAPRESSRGL